MTENELIVEAIEEIEEAKRNLLEVIKANCPGRHEFIQHRDMKPPWCHDCGYNNSGYKAEDYKITVTN